MKYGAFMAARHASLAEQLKALLAFRNRPEGPIEPEHTNWSVIPANDNSDPEEVVDYGFERQLRITPSVEEIMRNVKSGPTARNSDGQIVRIGKLRFSDGEQAERAYTHGPDGTLIQFDARMPAGAMLGTRDGLESQLGGKGYTDAELEQSNLYFAGMLDTIEPRYIKRTARRNGKSYTADESRVMLAEAYANTPVLPPVAKLKAGLPCGGKRIADSFIGMQKGKKGESGAIAWQDISSSMAQREIWQETIAQLAAEDIKTLDAATEAKTMRQIGEAHGFFGKRAERMGKRILAAANDNLADAMKISA